MGAAGVSLPTDQGYTVFVAPAVMGQTRAERRSLTPGSRREGSSPLTVCQGGGWGRGVGEGRWCAPVMKENMEVWRGRMAIN